MRFSAGLAVGIAAACLAGCSVGAASPSAARPAATAGRGTVTSTAQPAPPANPRMRAGARAAAAHFYAAYSARRYAAAWSLLASNAKHQIPRQVWVSVHDGCVSNDEKPRFIKAVTVFGTAAIVTEAVARTTAKDETTEDVFNDSSGRWRYSPDDVNIYQHGSVAADIAAARAAGYCATWEVF